MGKIDDTYTNPITEYWDWLDSLDSIAREAVLAEDKDGYGRPDPDFNGQAIIYMLNRCNTYEQFEQIAMPVFENKEHLILWWNIYIAGARFIADNIGKTEQENHDANS